MRHPSRSLFLVPVLCLATAAAGCGSKSAPGPAQARTTAPVRKAGTPAESLSPNLVAAVTTAKSGAGMLQVKYELQARPAVGATVDVDLVIVPQSDNIDQLSGTVQGDEGLEVLSGASIAPVEKLVFGTPIHHALKVRAKRDGIFTMSAVLTVESRGETLGPVYSMPVIAGSGQLDAGTAPGAAPAAAKSAAKTVGAQ